MQLGGATDVDGNFDLKQLEAGIYTVTANYSGYKQWMQGIAINAGTMSMVIDMIPGNRPVREVKIQYVKGLVRKPSK